MLGFLQYIASTILVGLEDRFRQERGSFLEWNDKAVQFGEAYACYRDRDA